MAAPGCRKESPVERLVRIPIGHGHLHQRAPVHHGPHPSLIFIPAGTHMACLAQVLAKPGLHKPCCGAEGSAGLQQALHAAWHACEWLGGQVGSWLHGCLHCACILAQECHSSILTETCPCEPMSLGVRVQDGRCLCTEILGSPDIMQHHALTVVETHSDLPALPLNEIAGHLQLTKCQPLHSSQLSMSC